MFVNSLHYALIQIMWWIHTSANGLMTVDFQPVIYYPTRGINWQMKSQEIPLVFL